MPVTVLTRPFGCQGLSPRKLERKKKTGFCPEMPTGECRIYLNVKKKKYSPPKFPKIPIIYFYGETLSLLMFEQQTERMFPCFSI